MKRTLLLSALAAALLAGVRPPGAAGAPRAVASILPVHSLLAGVMEGLGTPRLLVRGAASPHTYAMRPSDARALRRADAVFWVGEEFETFLSKPLRVLSRRARIVTLSKAEGVVLRPARRGGAWAPGGGAHRSPEEGASKEGRRRAPHGRTDMHIWLDPENARAMVRAMATVLSRIDPPNAAAYRANGAKIKRRLTALDGELRRRLRPYRATPYLVFHDAYQYFERRYGLNAAGAVALSPDRRPGARQLYEVRQQIAARRVRCLFREPQFEPRLVGTVTAGTGVRTGILDPLGARLPPGPAAYFRLMRALAEGLADCLGRK